MYRLPQILGITLGLTFAAIVLSRTGGRLATPPSAGPMLSECDGALREIVIQYVAGTEAVSTVYADFLPKLSADVKVDVVCPDQASFDELRFQLPHIESSLRPILTGHPMTAWSRDRWIALKSLDRNDAVTLLAPRGENAADVWPQRAGDERIAFDLGKTLSPHVIAERSALEFDGGDLLADGNYVFVTSTVLTRNLHRTIATRAELIEEFHRELHCPIVMMDDSPDHHAGMYMMAAADRTMLVADPRLAENLLPKGAAIISSLPGGADFSVETQHKLDAIAARCTSLGYRVVRIPTLPAMDGKTYLTYVNCISDVRGGRHIVYMPIYRGATAMNDAAERVWQSIGYEVRRVDCTSTYPLFGNLHCLVNVLRREIIPATSAERS